MSNIQKTGDLNYLANSTVYILDHSIYNKKSTNSFSVSGAISDPQPTFGKTDLVLSLNSGTNVSCAITDINNKNYTLDCNSDNEVNSDDLQSSYSKINDSILLLNFDQQTGSNNETSTSTGSRRIINKKSNGLGAGGIVGIALGSVAALGAVAAIAFFVNKASKPIAAQNYINSSSNLQVENKI